MIPECSLPDGRMREWHDWPESGPCRACGAPRRSGAKPPTPDQEEQIRSGILAGRPSRKIAQEAGVGRQTVQRRKKELKIVTSVTRDVTSQPVTVTSANPESKLAETISDLAADLARQNDHNRAKLLAALEVLRTVLK